MKKVGENIDLRVNMEKTKYKITTRRKENLSSII